MHENRITDYGARVPEDIMVADSPLVSVTTEF
jgi:hypothetical protein